jgi:hypothetical protein
MNQERRKTGKPQKIYPRISQIDSVGGSSSPLLDATMTGAAAN